MNQLAIRFFITRRGIVHQGETDLVVSPMFTYVPDGPGPNSVSVGMRTWFRLIVPSGFDPYTVTLTGPNTTVMGGVHFGDIVATTVSLTSAFPFCTGNLGVSTIDCLFAADGKLFPLFRQAASTWMRTKMSGTPPSPAALPVTVKSLSLVFVADGPVTQ